MPTRILYIAHDHLDVRRGALKGANPKNDVVVLVESRRMTSGRNWHPERLFFMISAARHFAERLSESGFEVSYIQAPTTIEGLRVAREKYGELPIFAAQPSSFRQLTSLIEYGVNWVENDFFLTSRELFTQWAGQQKTFVMETFYRAQRKRLGILMEGDQPVSGRWNFDADNRLPPPKNYEWPKPLEFERDEIDHAVAKQLAHTPTNTWATTRAGALKQLEHFIEAHLPAFGPFEDAVSDESWSMHHSLLSPYLNVGLLSPNEVVDAVLDAYAQGRAPIESVEAVVRQVIGWREYINGMYWYLGEDYRNKNGLSAERNLLPLFTDPTKTEMNCVSNTVKDVDERAWVHHIPRLMILSNLALVTGTNPQQFLDWMRERFIDASDWVMVPNVIGMATHADGGQLMTKPYAAGGAYLKRMTTYCKGCKYNPSERVGGTACPFTTLYWDFLDRHADEFRKNHRMFQQMSGLNRLKDRTELKVRAAEVLRGLELGVI
ncbi:MAG: cryptochrome/photolyase family protein [Micrococcales bacterium]